MRICLSILGLLAFLNLHSQRNTFLSLAQSLSDNQQYQASNEVLTNIIKKNPQRLYDLSNAHFLQSYNYMQLGAYFQAMAANRESLRLKEQLSLEGVGENYMRSGTIYLLAGDYDRALQNLLMAKDYPIESGEVYALIDGYLGSTYLELNQLEKAKTYFQQSIETLEIDFGNSHPDLATGYYNLGRLALAQKSYDEAASNLKKALKVAVDLRQHRTLGQIYNTLAKVYERTAPDEAYAVYEKAISLLSRQFGKYNIELARTYFNLSRYYLLEEEESKAREYLENAMASLLPNVNVRGWQFLPKADVFSLDPVLLIQVLGQRTHMLTPSVKPDVGEAELVLALESTRLATDMLAAHLATLGGEASRLLLTESLYTLFEPGIQVALALAKSKGEQSYASTAFELAEKGKAMISKAMAQSSDLLATKANKGIDLREALRAAQKNFEDHPQAEAVSQLQQARQNWRIYQEHLPFSSAPFKAESLEISQIQSQLHADELLLSYFLGTDNYYIFSVSKEGFKAQEIPNNYTISWKKKTLKKLFNPPALEPKTGVGLYSKIDPSLKLPDVSSAITAYRRAIKKMNGNEFVFYAADLYGKLIHPVIDQWPQKKRLLIIPHNELFTIPFEAFLTERPKEGKVKYHKLPYLIKDYSIRYAHSLAHAFPDSGRSPEYAYDFVGLAPVFSSEEENAYILDKHKLLFDTSYWAGEALRSITSGERYFKSLPFSEEEVVRIADLFSKEGKRSKAFLRQEATEEGFKTVALNARYLHLATHSFSELGNPALSGVAFAQQNLEGEKEDGILYLSEIQDLKLTTEMVVLSSCEGNTGPIIKGEGVASLARAFALAGSPRTLSALWSVFDIQTNALMQDFYSGLLKGKGYSDALQQAKLQMLKSKRVVPRMWSGFVLIGKGD